MLRCNDLKTVTDVSKDWIAFIFGTNSQKSNSPEDKVGLH